MMYCEKFVVCVKVNGKILRENKDIVYLPFGTEYSILLKNLNTRRAKVKIYIDGEDVHPGTSLIIDKNSETELEGFMSGNQVTHKFKFIEKTEDISNYRGDFPEDGLIRVVYSFEEDFDFSWGHHHHHHYHYNNFKYSADYNTKYNNSGTAPRTWLSFNCNSQPKNSLLNECTNCSYDAGITVKGSESNQQFNYASFGLSGEEHVIILHLKGKKKDTIVERPITTKTKITCNICGKRSSSNNKFCPNCGTALF